MSTKLRHQEDELYGTLWAPFGETNIVRPYGRPSIHRYDGHSEVLYRLSRPRGQLRNNYPKCFARSLCSNLDWEEQVVRIETEHAQANSCRIALWRVCITANSKLFRRSKKGYNRDLFDTANIFGTAFGMSETSLNMGYV